MCALAMAGELYMLGHFKGFKTLIESEATREEEGQQIWTLKLPRIKILSYFIIMTDNRSENSRIKPKVRFWGL